jgi:hypothetical protein
MYWRCYYCGSSIPAAAPECPACGRGRSKLVYILLWGVIGGLAGSLTGFTAYGVAGALAGGLVGILLFEIAARLSCRSRRRI